MSDNYVKYNRCEKARWLRKHHIYAFVLLSVIAESARRTIGHVDGLIPGDAWIGDFEEYGMTRQNYRTALKTLEKLKIVKIVHSGKKLFESRNLTICLTNKGTLVNLLDTEIWNINKEDANHLSNQDLTNSQPTANHKQERNKKEKNVNKNKASLSASAVAITLLFFFNSSLKQHVPEVANPDETNPAKSAKSFDTLLKSYSEDEIRKTITFCHTGWWSDKVHTPDYLRKKFTQLLAAMRREKNPNTNKPNHNRPVHEEYNDRF